MEKGKNFKIRFADWRERFSLVKWLLAIALAGLFFLSGFSALAYEILWIRDFSYLLGGSTYTLSVVLAAYMAGLAGGSLAAGKWVSRFNRPLLVYALLEAGVGICGLGVRWLLQGGVKDLGPIGVLNNENIGPMLLRFLVSFAILFPPTFLMGATLPFLTKYFKQKGGWDGLLISLLYGANTLGAASGCFSTGFFFMRLWGMAQTTRLAVIINLAISGVALILDLLAHRFWEKEDSSPSQSKKASKSETAWNPSGRFLLAAFCLSGFTCLSYEILYSRVLCYILGNRVYASSAMITTFLLGIALGSLSVGWFIDWVGGEVALFSLFQTFTGLAGAAAVVFFPQALDRIKTVEAGIHFTDPWQYVAVRFSEAAVLLFLPAFSFGAIFPSVIKYLNRMKGELSGVTGRAYAANTLGCILGSMVTGFVIIPLLGSYYGMVAVAVLSILLGHRLLAPAWEMAPAWRRAVTVVFSLGLAIGTISMARAHCQYPWPRKDLVRIFSYEDASALVTVYAGPLGYYLYGDDTNLSFPIGSRTRAVAVQKLQAHIPLLLHPHPKKVLVIGMGFGVTAGSFATYPGLDPVECVEFFPGVIKAGPIFKDANLDVNQNPKVKLVSGDGRYFLRHAATDYDIITSNLTGSDLPGSASCYTKEYFELARGKLASDGLFLVHAYGRDKFTILKTLQAVFPDVVGFRAYKGTYYLIASFKPLQINPKQVENRLRADAEYRKDAGRAGIFGVKDLNHFLLFNNRDARRLADKEPGPLNTDDLPVLEYKFRGRDLNVFYGHF